MGSAQLTPFEVAQGALRHGYLRSQARTARNMYRASKILSIGVGGYAPLITDMGEYVYNAGYGNWSTGGTVGLALDAKYTVYEAMSNGHPVIKGTGIIVTEGVGLLPWEE